MRWQDEMNAQPGPLGRAAPHLMLLHYYAVVRYSAGIVAETSAARAAGAARDDAVNVIVMAWIHAGPFGVNTVSEVVQPHLDDWTEPRSQRTDWPAGWHVDPGALRCGVDFDTANDSNAMGAEEFGKIAAWHRRVQGEVPDYVRVLAKDYPLGLRVMRARYETTLAIGLPIEFIALCQLHLATSWAHPRAVRRMLNMAAHFGAGAEAITETLALSRWAEAARAAQSPGTALAAGF